MGDIEHDHQLSTLVRQMTILFVNVLYSYMYLLCLKKIYKKIFCYVDKLSSFKIEICKLNYKNTVYW